MTAQDRASSQKIAGNGRLKRAGIGAAGLYRPSMAPAEEAILGYASRGASPSSRGFATRGPMAVFNENFREVI